MRYTEEQIREANAQNIVDVAEKLGIAMKRQGATVMALCPCHEDRHPSMQIGGRKNIAHCYVCGKTLNPIGLVMEVAGKSFKEAMEALGLNQWGQTPLIHQKQHKRSVSYVNQWGQTPLIQYFSMEYVDAHVSIDNALSKCLLQRFPREVVERVTQMYRLGHDEGLLHYEHTWFPSIDEQGRVRNIKVQGYCTNPDVPQFGHCNKEETRWLGKMLKTTQEGEFDNECLFQPLSPALPQRGGSSYNRLSESTNRGAVHSVLPFGGGARMGGEGPYILVESPKNAVVGACWTMTYRPELDVTWVAVGNKNMLKRSVLEPLRGKKVIVIPDRDAVDEWKAKLTTMRDLATFVFSSFCDSTDDPENKKLDIADLMMKGTNHKKNRS